MPNIRITSSYLCQKFELRQTAPNVIRHILSYNKREARLSEYCKFWVAKSDSTNMFETIEHLSALTSFCLEYEDWRFEEY
jgi:hypothetical protein